MPSIPNDIPEVLQQFFKQYLAWVEAGCPDNTFVKDSGLCWNLHRWLRMEIPCHDSLWAGLREYMQNNLLANTHYPFNPPVCGVDSWLLYDTEAEREECHLNPQRLAFVREVVASCQQ